MLIIPTNPASESANLWLGFEGSEPPSACSLTFTRRGGDDNVYPIEPTWEKVASGADFWVSRSRVDGLLANTRYAIYEGPSGAPAAAVLRTLPSRLPMHDVDEPFTVLVGSCFSYETGKQSAIGRCVRSLPANLYPHMKVLCGDQVYLDLPVQEDLPHNLAKLRRKLLRKYRSNWNQGKSAVVDGFGAFLRQGSNLFTSDDHEYWNNFPAAQAHLPITYLAGSRSNYAEASKELFCAFQAPYPLNSPPGTAAVQHVTVGVPGTSGSLEIVAIDGRHYRDNGNDTAHKPEDLAYAIQWLTTLRSPGVLVLSQPLFAEPAGWFKKKWVDGWLANYSDYKPLARALDKAPHDVLILSGDIHRARYATAKGGPGKSTLHEVVSSPLSLIAAGKHKASPAPGRFPNPATSGVSSREVVTRLAGTGGNNFATISFRSLQRTVLASVKYWPVPEVGSSTSSASESVEIVLR